jgi:hypothetical protein
MDPILQNSVRKQKELQLKQTKSKTFQKPLTPYQLERAKQRLCQSWYFQSYNNFDKDQKLYLPNVCIQHDVIQSQNCQAQKAYNRTQNLLHQFRVNPQKYPLTSWTYKNGLNKNQQRQYSNMWYRRIGASNACGSVQPGYPYSVNLNWPSSAITGSQVSYTDGFNNTGYY